MDELCAAYQDPVTGENSCARIQKDKRCQLDDEMSLHKGIAIALAFTGYNADPAATKSARLKLCECSCFSDIVDVYTPIFEMWKHYDPEVEDKMSLLQTSTVAGLCTKDVTASLNAKVEESNGAQCGENKVTLRFFPNKRLPEHTVITVTGLNAHLPTSGLKVVVDSVRVVAADYTPAQCSRWCSKQGLCESSASAVDEGCSALPGFMENSSPVGGKDAIGLITSGRCMRWCDTDAVLKVVLNSAVDAFTMSIDLRNPTYEQTPPTIMVSASGPGIYAPLEAAEASGSTAKVLRAETPPSFVTFIATEVDVRQYDVVQSVWRGNGPGMRNTLTITVQPNVVLLPGARVTLSGLIRGHSDSISTTIYLPPPAVRQISGFFIALAIESWDAQGGTLVLRVTPGSGIPADAETRFALEMQMPSASSGSGVGDPEKPKLQIQASRAGVGLICEVQPKALTHTVLNSLPMSDAQFVRKIAMQDKCWPGECSVISFTIAVSTALQESPDVSFTISGLQGMEKPARNTCYPSDACGDTLSSLIPMFDTVVGANHVNLFASSGTFVKTAYAAWDAVAGTLTFNLAKGAAIAPYRDYSFKVNFRNGYVGIQSDVHIRASFGSVSSGSVPMDLNGAAAIQVCAPGFLSKSVRQSYPWPGCSAADYPKNTMTVVLQPNVRMVHPSNITITQVVGVPNNICVETATTSVPTDKQACEAVAGAALSDAIACQAVKRDCALVGNTCPATNCETAGAKCVYKAGAACTFQKRLEMLTVSSCVETAATSVPSDKTKCDEVADLSDATECVAVKRDCGSAKSGSCPAGCTDPGAAGQPCSQTSTAEACTYVKALQTQFSFVNAPVGGHASIVLVLKEGHPMEAGKTYQFSFEFKNPPQDQPAPDIGVSAVSRVSAPAPAGHFTIAETKFAKNTGAPKVVNSKAFSTEGTGKTLCSSLPPIADRTSDGEAAALSVAKPAFVIKKIGQSSPYPDAQNSITITIAANVALYGKKAICVEKAAVSVAADKAACGAVTSEVDLSTKDVCEAVKRDCGAVLPCPPGCAASNNKCFHEAAPSACTYTEQVSGTRITVSGLDAVAPASATLHVDEKAADCGPVAGCPAGCSTVNDKCVHSKKLKGTATWSKELGGLVFEMAYGQTWTTSTSIVATVTITNPGSCTTSPTVRISASACPVGTYNSLDNGVSACTVCPTGKYAATTGLTVCADCAAGKYEAATGMRLVESCNARSLLRISSLRVLASDSRPCPPQANRCALTVLSTPTMP